MSTSTPQEVGGDLRFPVFPRLTPHPEAPLFQRTDAKTIFQQTVDLISGGNFPQVDEVREAFRQAGFVSLWFFLKFIAGYNGPYDELDTQLHLDMANFYQLLYEKPGTMGAGFLPRGALKSTIFTHGGNTWELVRDQDQQIVLASSIIDRAYEFMHTTQRTFDDNEFFAWLYPKHVPEKGAPRWNDREMVMPHRTRNRPNPSIKPIAAGGSTQGVHGLLFKVDDIVGDKDLDSQRMGAASMTQRKNWLSQSINPIVTDWKKGRVFVTGTRYGVDDAYENIFKKLAARYGYWDELPYELSENGMWHVYYRMVEEHGEIIMPEKYTREGLEQLKEDDFWTYITQYANNPFGAETSELTDYVENVGGASVMWDAMEKDFLVTSYNKVKQYEKSFYLKDCDVLTGCDPAGTERNLARARTSRSCAIVYARTPADDRVIVRLDADYVSAPQMMNWLFRNMATYPAITRTVLEMQGSFKILDGILREEQQRREKWLNVRPVTATSDKVVRIRNLLAPILSRSQLFIPDEFLMLFKEELVSFPLSKKMDILDTLAICERASHRPPSADDEDDEDDFDVVSEYELTRNPVTGY